MKFTIVPGRFDSTRYNSEYDAWLSEDAQQRERDIDGWLDAVNDAEKRSKTPRWRAALGRGWHRLLAFRWRSP